MFLSMLSVCYVKSKTMMLKFNSIENKLKDALFHSDENFRLENWRCRIFFFRRNTIYLVIPIEMVAKFLKSCWTSLNGFHWKLSL